MNKGACGAKCNNSSSSSSSSSSCSTSSSSSSCDVPACTTKDCTVLPPKVLECMFQDAVVSVHSTFVLVGASGSTATAVTGGTPIAANARADIFLDGNGFFIKGHYIVCPAQLVLMPPSLTAVAKRYPYFDSSAITGSYTDTMLRASRILVSVFNVNGKGCSYEYEADLVGVDGAGDIAVLRINYNTQWNLCNPCVDKCHPFLTFGKSRALRKGEEVYLLGNYDTDTGAPLAYLPALTPGLVADYRYLEPSGEVLAESVALSFPVFRPTAGSPIITGQGRVVAMQTAGLGITGFYVTGVACGPSSFFMKPVVKSIIEGLCNKKYNCKLETICDPICAYYRYRKGWMGLGYRAMTGGELDMTEPYSAAADPLRVRLDANGNFLSGPKCKVLQGVQVLGLAGINPDDAAGVAGGGHYVPGGTGTVAPFSGLTLPASPLLGKLTPGDVVTRIDNLKLGIFGNEQIAPSIITWKLCQGDQLCLTYRRGGLAANTADNSLTDNYENEYSYTICVSDYPKFLDYPWYSRNFPLLSAYGFTFPNNLNTTTNDPGVTTGENVFSPSV